MKIHVRTHDLYVDDQLILGRVLLGLQLVLARVLPLQFPDEQDGVGGVVTNAHSV